MEREKGVQSTTCPTCGTVLLAESGADGSTVYQRCRNCYPVEPGGEERALAVEDVLPRQTGTVLHTKAQPSVEAAVISNEPIADAVEADLRDEAEQ